MTDHKANNRPAAPSLGQKTALAGRGPGQGRIEMSRC